MGMFDRFKKSSEDDDPDEEEQRTVRDSRYSDGKDDSTGIGKAANTHSRFSTDYRSYLAEEARTAQENLNKRTQMARASIRPAQIPTPASAPASNPVAVPSVAVPEVAADTPKVVETTDSKTSDTDPDTGIPSAPVKPQKEPMDDGYKSEEHEENKKSKNIFARLFHSDDDDDEDYDDDDEDDRN